MRYKLLFLFLLLAVFPTSSIAKKNWDVKAVIIEPVQNEDGVFSIDSIDFHVITKYERGGNLLYNAGYLYFFLTNRTNHKIYIEWENARIDGNEKVVFGSDSYATARDKKEDEPVSAGENSEYKNIIPLDAIDILSGIGVVIYPYWTKKDLKKGENITTTLKIPIKTWNSEAKDYKFTVKYIYTEND